ncbi:hypothetical protein [Streptomyces sp. NPDC048473]|uniref:hypothetical protein n=1 Tax=unclassified Streptomyces TaxID=2593676 RepID=UPI00371727B2
MAIAHMYATCHVVEERSGGGGGASADLTGAKESLTESFKTLWFRESALRLSVGREEAEQAEVLMRLARRAVDDVTDLAEAIWTHQDTGPPQGQLETAMAELRAGVEEWAHVARLKLGAGDSH